MQIITQPYNPRKKHQEVCKELLLFFLLLSQARPFPPMAKSHKQTQVALIPSPGMGHLIPIAQLAKRLVHLHPDLSITIIVPSFSGSNNKPQTSVLSSLPPSVTSVFLPPPDFSDVPPEDLKIETIISLTVARSLPAIREAIVSSTRSPLAAVVCDLFGTDCFEVAREFGAASYVFFPSTAMALSLLLHSLPKLDETVSCEYRELDELVRIPGCVPIHGRELLDPLQDRKNDAYKWVLHHSKRYWLADGIMVNSFPELERGALKALRDPEPGKPTVYPVGPLVDAGTGPGRGGGAECLRWLDDQPHGSVIYVSFGSGGTLSYEQTTELALGLEMSDQRFLWVVRSPSYKAANDSFFSAQSESDPFGFLPKGFLERTKNRGLVLDSWAPQAQVLSHSSTGGFLTHSGWNSTLESIVNGVPLVVWPLYAEQKMNAVMLVEDIKVALRPKASGPNGIIGREEISNVVRNLMEGEEGKTLRSRMKNLKDAAGRNLREDGSSTKAISQVVANWKQHIN